MSSWDTCSTKERYTIPYKLSPKPAKLHYHSVWVVDAGNLRWILHVEIPQNTNPRRTQSQGCRRDYHCAWNVFSLELSFMDFLRRQLRLERVVSRGSLGTTWTSWMLSLPLVGLALLFYNKPPKQTTDTETKTA